MSPPACAGRRLSPREALDAYHRRIDQERWDLRETPDGLIEAERRRERLRAEGWSEAAIKHRREEKHPLCGAIDTYYEGSLTPSRVEYVGQSMVSRRRSVVRIRFPWWRSGIGG